LNKHFIYLGIVVLLAGLAGYLFATQPIRRGLDVQGGLRMTLRAEIEKLSPEEQKLWTPERMRLVIDILSRRIDSLGVLEPTIYQKGDTEIVIELPGFHRRAGGARPVADHRAAGVSLPQRCAHG
jgi:preprotein translocase subunit SecD